MLFLLCIADFKLGMAEPFDDDVDEEPEHELDDEPSRTVEVTDVSCALEADDTDVI